jgi:hypothetical protein
VRGKVREGEGGIREEEDGFLGGILIHRVHERRFWGKHWES